MQGENFESLRAEDEYSDLDLSDFTITYNSLSADSCGYDLSGEKYSMIVGDIAKWV